MNGVGKFSPERKRFALAEGQFLPAGDRPPLLEEDKFQVASAEAARCSGMALLRWVRSEPSGNGRENLIGESLLQNGRRTTNLISSALGALPQTPGFSRGMAKSSRVGPFPSKPNED